MPALAIRRPGLRPSVAAALALVAVSMLALTLGGGFRSAGGVEGATATQTGGSIGSSTSPPSSSPTAAVTPTRSQAPAGPTVTDPEAPTPLAAQGTDATPTPTPTPTPKPTPTPTPNPTPKPTPTPTPKPTATPAPTPTPACATVPDLVGMTVTDARAAWRAAGFTGTFTVSNHGPETKKVTKQDQTAGACLPPDTAISVTTA